MAAENSRVAPLATARNRKERNDNGTSGSAARASTATKATARTTARTRGPAAVASPQLDSPARSSPYTRATRAPVPSTAPGTSRRAARPALLSGTRRGSRTTAARATGRLIRKIQRQDARPVRAPEITRPIVPPRAAIPPQIPNALARSAEPGKRSAIRASAAGLAIAEPAPWTNRPATSCQGSCASPQTRLAAPNRATPVRKTRLRPSRSAMRPNSSNRPPKARK